MGREEKVEEVKELKEAIDQYPVIGLLDMYKMPSMQLQQIRKQLRNKAVIKMTKKSVLEFALEGANKKNVKELEKHVPKQPAIAFTQLEAFKFYNLVNKLKFPTYAKEGDVARSDIKVSAGPTSLLPGPVISELQRVGIPASVEEGKIAIRKDVTVVRKDEQISKDLANALRKLNIQPMEVALNVIAIYDNGMIYGKEALRLVTEFPNKLMEAYNQALNLSVVICYPTKQNIKYLLTKAYREANILESLQKVKNE